MTRFRVMSSISLWSGSVLRDRRSMTAVRVSFSPVVLKGSSLVVPISTRPFAGCGPTPKLAPTASTRRASIKVDQVVAIVAAVAPKPVNLLINSPFITVAQTQALGVRRISVGGALAWAAWKGWLAAATEIEGPGTLTAFGELPNVEALFSRP
jgi:hypothetical protein